MHRRLIVAFLTASALAGGGHATAWADIGEFLEYARLADAKASPAALVLPTIAAPKADERLLVDGSAERGGKQYRLRLVWAMTKPPFTHRAIIFLRRGRVPTLAALRKELRFGGYRVKPLRIRNRPGLLATRTSPGFSLAWVEKGLVYELGTGQPRRVPLIALRQIARDLEPISQQYVGSADLPDGRNASAVGFTTATTISLAIDITGNCTAPAGAPVGLTQLAGSGQLMLAPRQGANFSAAIPSPAKPNLGLPGWTIAGSGAVAADAIALTVDATITAPPSLYFPGGGTCATDPMSILMSPVGI